MRIYMSWYDMAGEACLAPTKPCGGKAIDVILLPLQGTKMWVSVPPKALPWADILRAYSAYFLSLKSM